eukprot:3514568-Rhodomonas_salina.1
MHVRDTPETQVSTQEVRTHASVHTCQMSETTSETMPEPMPETCSTCMRVRDRKNLDVCRDSPARQHTHSHTCRSEACPTAGTADAHTHQQRHRDTHTQDMHARARAD